MMSALTPKADIDWGDFKTLSISWSRYRPQKSRGLRDGTWSSSLTLS